MNFLSFPLTVGLSLALLPFAPLAAHGTPAVKRPPAAHPLPPGAADLGPATTWTSLGSVRDHLGTHTRWAQSLHGIPVLGSELITHEAGGAVQPPTYSLALARGAGGVPFLPPILGAEVPGLTADQAAAALAARFGPRAQPPGLSKPRLVYFPVMRSLDLGRPGENDALAMPRVVAGYVLAFVIEVRGAGEPHDPQDATYVLNAHTGKVLDERPLAQRLEAPGRVRASTWDSGRVLLDVTLLDRGPRLRLRDPHRGREGGNTVEDLGGQWDPRQAKVYESTAMGGEIPGDLDRTAASAAFGLAAAWDYFGHVHGRKGYDGSGSRVRLLVNGPGADNAHWAPEGGVGAITVAGPGDFQPLVHPAILGHEFTHGVVNARARLNGSKEAKALGEGTCDFFGQMIDTWSRTGGGNRATRLSSNVIGDRETAWAISLTRRTKEGAGETVVMRDLAEPARSGCPDRWTPELAQIPDEHHAAGPLNRALCFLSRGAAAVGSPESRQPRSLTGAPSWTSDLLPGGMRGIGNDRTAAIWYAVLDEELQPMSDYRDARKAALKVARRLYGEESREDLAVRDAFGAVGVGRPGRLADPVDAWLPSVAVEAVPHGEDLDLTVTVPDPAQVKSVAFLVDGVQVGKEAGAPFRLRVPASRLLANGAHRFQAALRDVEDQVVLSKAAEFSLANRVQQLVVDPSLQFEDDASRGWITDARSERPAPPPPAGGADGWCRTFDAATLRPGRHPVLSQRLTLPPAPVHLQLSLWVQVPTSPRPGAEDELSIRVQSDGPLPVQELARLAPTAPTEGWTRLTFPLDTFAGATIDLQFLSRFKEGSTTVFRVAEVRILASAEAIPAP